MPSALNETDTSEEDKIAAFHFLQLVRKRLKQRRRERRKMTQKTQRGQVCTSKLGMCLLSAHILDTCTHAHSHTNTLTQTLPHTRLFQPIMKCRIQNLLQKIQKSLDA